MNNQPTIKPRRQMRAKTKDRDNKYTIKKLPKAETNNHTVLLTTKSTPIDRKYLHLTNFMQTLST